MNKRTDIKERKNKSNTTKKSITLQNNEVFITVKVNPSTTNKTKVCEDWLIEISKSEVNPKQEMC